MTARMLVATRRKVVRKSARDWPEKSCFGRISEVHFSCGWLSGTYDLAFVDVAGAVEEGVHCKR